MQIFFFLNRKNVREEAEKAGDHVTDTAVELTADGFKLWSLFLETLVFDYEVGCCAGTRRWFVVFLVPSSWLPSGSVCVTV